MGLKKLPLIAAIFFVIDQYLCAQQNLQPQSSKYEWPTQPELRAKLEKWQDQKFGIILHWGLYAVPGVIESWSICSENWIERDSTISYDDYKKSFFGLDV
jgi:alpha-L-fucosidase